MRASAFEKFTSLTLRNLKIYFRDYMTIFYSLLSMFITIGLMVFFLGDLSAQGIVNALSQFPGRDAATDTANANMLILIWTGGGIISINAVTVTLACFSGMIDDRKAGRLNAIYTAPISRGTITLSYIAYAWVASLIICAITLGVFEVIAVFKGMQAFSLAVHCKLLGVMCVNSWTFSALMYMLSLLVKTSGAWGAIGTVVGTLVGFFGGIYLPLGSLDSRIQAVIKCFPVIYSSSAFRSIMMQDIMEKTFDGLPSELAEEVTKQFGVSISAFNHSFSAIEDMLLVGLFGIIFMTVSIVILKKSKLNDR